MSWLVASARKYQRGSLRGPQTHLPLCLTAIFRRVNVQVETVLVAAKSARNWTQLDTMRFLLFRVYRFLLSRRPSDAFVRVVANRPRLEPAPLPDGRRRIRHAPKGERHAPVVGPTLDGAALCLDEQRAAAAAAVAVAVYHKLAAVDVVRQLSGGGRKQTLVVLVEGKRVKDQKAEDERQTEEGRQHNWRPEQT